MNPWTLIGWLILAGFFGWLALIALAVLIRLSDTLAALRRHYATRNTAFHKGQVWVANGRNYMITSDLYPKGHFSVQSGDRGCHVTIGYTPEEFQRFIRRNRAYLSQS